MRLAAKLILWLRDRLTRLYMRHLASDGDFLQHYFHTGCWCGKDHTSFAARTYEYPDLLQTLKGNEIWLSQCKVWAPLWFQVYLDDQIDRNKVMYNTVQDLKIDQVKVTARAREQRKEEERSYEIN